MITMVKLTTGDTAPLPLVATTLISLEGLLTDHGIVGACALSDLAEVAEDGSIPASGERRTLLESLGLLDHDGRVHRALVPILRAAIEGEGLNLRLVHPVSAAV